MRDGVQVAIVLPYTCGMVLTLLDIMVSGNSGECRRSERCGRRDGTTLRQDSKQKECPRRLSTTLKHDLAAARGYRRPPACAGVRFKRLCTPARAPVRHGHPWLPLLSSRLAVRAPHKARM